MITSWSQCLAVVDTSDVVHASMHVDFGGHCYHKLLLTVL